jgi:hypothetical protein
MVQWEYKVHVVGLSDNPYNKKYGPVDPTKWMEELLGGLGKEGWELMHVKDVTGEWVSNPERYPGGDRGRMTWNHGMTIMYFKRLKGEGS